MGKILCFNGSPCIEILDELMDNKLHAKFIGSSTVDMYADTAEQLYALFQQNAFEDEVHLATEDRLLILKALRDHSDTIVKSIVENVIEDEQTRLSKLKMYILVREDISTGHSINWAAHAAAKAVREWSGDDDFEKWYNNSFRKVTCKVSRGQFEDAKKFEDHIIISEDVLNDTEVAIVFKPRSEWPEQFKRFRLYS